VLQAGAAAVDITPKLGTQLAGDIGRYRPAETVHDRLYARALVLAYGGRKLCLVSLDLCCASRFWSDEIRRRAADELDTEPEAVMVHSLQLHSAPNLAYDLLDLQQRIPPELGWLRGAEAAYHVFAVERILEAVRQANARLTPVTVSVASAIEGRVAFNRRFVMRDGSVRTHPITGDPLIRYAEGPLDPELGVVCLSTEDMRVLALLLYYTCHPCHGYPHRYVSADWPGAWADGMRAAYGAECVPLVLNGCCGNIHHTNHLDPKWTDDQERMGGILTETARQALKRPVAHQRDPVLDWRSHHLRIPIRELSPSELSAAQQLLAEHPQPMWADEAHTQVEWDWMYAVARLDMYELRQSDPLADYEIQVFRIGGVAIVGLPGEPFVEGGLRIKLESPTYPTYVVHMCNDSEGYIPTEQAFARGGYETWTANWSRLVPQALDMIADATAQVLRELF